MLQGTPTDTDVITKLTNIIHNDIDFGNTPDYMNVKKEDIIQAIDKLNSNKGDGGDGFNSNHLIYGKNILHTYLASLINVLYAMVTHHLTFPNLTLFQFPKTRGAAFKEVIITEESTM